MLVLGLVAMSLAQPVEEAADTGGTERSLSARYRFLAMPMGVLNPWYYPSDETRLPRPTARAHVVGAELGLDPRSGTFSVWGEAWLVDLEDGYWDDVESPVDHTDGDWIASRGVGMVALGGNFGQEWAVTADEKPTWLGFAVTAGLGIGIPWGTFDRWQPGWATEPLTDCGPLASSDERAGSCPADETSKPPPVLPVLDLSLVWRLHLAERGLVRLEGGLHDVPYVGVAAGAVL